MAAWCASEYRGGVSLFFMVTIAGHERTVSEAADLLYHALVLLNHEGVSLEEVGAELRRRFALSGLEEKASRPPKQPIAS